MVCLGNNMEEFEILNDVRKFVKGVTEMWQEIIMFLTFKAFVPLGEKMKTKGGVWSEEQCNRILKK